MNREQRKEIKELIKQLEVVKDKIDSIRDDEEDKFDNLSEGLQATMRGQDMEDAISNMEDAIDNIAEAVANLEVI